MKRGRKFRFGLVLWGQSSSVIAQDRAATEKTTTDTLLQSDFACSNLKQWFENGVKIIKTIEGVIGMRGECWNAIRVVWCHDGCEMHGLAKWEVQGCHERYAMPWGKCGTMRSVRGNIMRRARLPTVPRRGFYATKGCEEQCHEGFEVETMR